MPDPPVVVVPGKPADTTTPLIVVVGFRTAGTYTFTVTVTDDAGLKGSGSVDVIVLPG